MAKNQKVTLHIKLSDGSVKDVSFIVPAVESVPQVTTAPVVELIMDTVTRREVIDRFFLEYGKKQTETKVIHWGDVTDPLQPDALSSEAYVFIEPTEGGKYMTVNGEAFITTEQPGLQKYWVNDDGSDKSVVYQLMDTFRRGDNITVAGDGTNRHGLFSVKLSKKSGNALSIDTENGGLFAEASGGGEGGLTNVAHDKSLYGSGTTADPLGFMIIGRAGDSDGNNILEVREQAHGRVTLRVPHVAEVMHDTPSIVSVVGNDGEGGQKTLTDVQLSGRADNALQILGWGADGGAGLFVPQGKTLTRVPGSGNWSFGYSDTPGAKNACGKMGSGVYWKSTIPLSSAPVGNTDVPFRVWLKNLPCMEDGTLVSHRVIADYIGGPVSSSPTVAIWLICDTPPTHMINIETKTITKLQRGQDSQTTGLPDYPVAPEGEVAEEFTYSREYFYMK